MTASGKEQQFIELMNQMCRVPTMSVACVKVVVFSTGTAEASVSILNRPPANEETPSVKRTNVGERTSPEGIIHWVVV